MSLEEQFDKLVERVEALEKQNEHYQHLLAQIDAGMERAKTNPMIANLMRMMGL